MKIRTYSIFTCAVLFLLAPPSTIGCDETEQNDLKQGMVQLMNDIVTLHNSHSDLEFAKLLVREDDIIVRYTILPISPPQPKTSYTIIISRGQGILMFEQAGAPKLVRLENVEEIKASLEEGARIARNAKVEQNPDIDSEKSLEGVTMSLLTITSTGTNLFVRFGSQPQDFPERSLRGIATAITDNWNANNNGGKTTDFKGTGASSDESPEPR